MNNTRIEKDFYFHAALHFENKFYINAYDLTLSLLIETDSVREQNVCVERISYFIDELFKNCIFIYAGEGMAKEQYHASSIRICELPEEPYDQLVGMVIMQKLNAILEKRMKLTDMVISSSMSDGVRYTIISEISENVLDGNFWWNKNDMTLCDSTGKFCDRDNVVSLFSNDEWENLGLSWKEKAN